MRKQVNRIVRSVGIAVFVLVCFFAAPERVFAGTLSSASVVANTYTAGVSATYTFTYTTATTSPNMILYAIFPSGFSTAALGSPLDTGKVTVTVDGVPKSINSASSFATGQSLAIRLTTASDAGAGAVIVVTANGVVNHSTPGSYSGWTWIRTADSGGNEIDGWPGVLPTLTITAGGSRYISPRVQLGRLVPDGVMVIAGAKQMVFWTADGEGVSKYRVSYSIDGGKIYRKVGEGNDPSRGYYAWIVPQVATRHGRLKLEILDYSGTVLSTAESEPFRVIPAKRPSVSGGIMERLMTVFGSR